MKTYIVCEKAIRTIAWFVEAENEFMASQIYRDKGEIVDNLCSEGIFTEIEEGDGNPPFYKEENE